jgi:hypothetical protein
MGSSMARLQRMPGAWHDDLRRGAGLFEDSSASARASSRTVLDWGQRLPPMQHGCAVSPLAAARGPLKIRQGAPNAEDHSETTVPRRPSDTPTQPLARTDPGGPGEQPLRLSNARGPLRGYLDP